MISATMIIRMLNEIGIPILHRHIKLRNVVGSVNIGERVDNDYLASMMQENGSYELGLFPGLVWRPEGTKATILCFQSGKMVVTGCKSEKDMEMTKVLVEELKAASANRTADVDAPPVHKYSQRALLG